MAAVQLGTVRKVTSGEVSSRDAALGKGAVLPMRLESVGSSRQVDSAPQEIPASEVAHAVKRLSSSSTSPSISASSTHESFGLVQRLQDPTGPIAIKHTILALFKDGTRAVTREEYREATVLREELFVLAAREFQKNRAESDLEAAGQGPALQLVRGIASSLSLTERCAFYVALADSLERQVEPPAASLYQEMILREPPAFRSKLFDYARLCLGRGAEGARGIVGIVCQQSLEGSNSLIPPRQALEALVESVFVARGITTQAGARDHLYNGRVKGVLMRNLARPERARDVLDALISLERRGALEIRGETDVARCREALESVCALGAPSYIAHVLDGMAGSGNLAMMCAAKDCVLHGDTSNVPAAFAQKTVSAIAATVSYRGTESAQELEDKASMLRVLSGSVFSPRVSHKNVVEILHAAVSHNSVWGTRRNGWEILKSDPIFARRVAFLCSGDLGRQGEPLRQHLRELLREDLLALATPRHVTRSVSCGVISSSVGEDILAIRAALFSRAERAFSWVRGVLN